MEELKTKIGSDIYQKLLDGNIDTLSSILISPLSELKQLTNIPVQQLQVIKKRASEIVLKNKFVTAYDIPPWERLSTGCNGIDSVLAGGIPINGITEIFGCSGVGKTQLGLQLSLMIQLPPHLGGKEKEAVYICTEGVFPSKRFHQLTASFKAKYNLSNLDLESRVYLEHAADFEQLRRCIYVRLPQLLCIKNVGLVIIDSIAGVFRSENNDTCYTARGQDINVIASALHGLYDKFGIAIICINQVTDNLATGKTEPCLGLTWSNNITCRFNVSRSELSQLREFEVVFAPDLPNRKCCFIITEQGIVDTK